ncbi:LPXTG cell wall anchor domain-containing protein [Ihubacter sp. mB4P-1]|uniref:LPXTG cell wall anchor domain-containing protein n=1 Tax=Ihubacter sp. mB4P-1 TaxID=3242370 RepID=UPI003C7DA220
MKKLNKVIAPLLAMCMTAMTGVAVFADTAESTADDSRVLICEKEVHTHTDACSVPTLKCEVEEHKGHKHVQDCYVKKVRTCLYDTLEEWIEREGTDEGYDESFQYQIDPETGEITDQLHVHTDECYKFLTYPEPMCGKTEGEHHEESCYVTCTKEEHQHTDGCYENAVAPVDPQPPVIVLPENPDVPLAPEPDGPIIEEPDVPLAPAPDEPIIDEPDVPLAPGVDLPEDEYLEADEEADQDVNCPKTGDHAPLAALAGMFILSAGLLGAITIRRKHEF